jgi:beta-glucosidase
VEFTLKNSGNKNGEEVVQLYVKEDSRRDKAPVKSLKAFKRILLKAGEQTKVSFSLSLEELKHWDTKTHAFVLEPAVFEIQLGASSKDIRLSKQVEIK